MAQKYAIDTASVTPVLASSGRFDLLEQTVESFLEHFDADRIVVVEDSQEFGEAAAFADAFPQIEMRSCWERLGQMRALDALYARAHTPYVLQLGEDWCFTDGADLADACDFLEARSDISVVCVGWRPEVRFAEKTQTQIFRGSNYLVCDLDAHASRFSYSFNPSVTRTALWRQIGPFAKFRSEESLSSYCKARGMRIAMLERPIAYHLGQSSYSRETLKSRYAENLLSRLRRSAARHWPVATGERLQWR